MEANINFEELKFNHFVDVPRCDCVFGNAKDQRTGRTHLFLIFNHEGPIYRRNGLKEQWEVLESKYCNYVRKLFNRAGDIPRYSTANLVSLN